MTDKELKKLSRAELLELLLIQTQEVERLKQQLEQAQQQLEQRSLDIEKAGNIAQAALQLSGVFQAAQSAADQYLENIATLEGKTREKCRIIEAQTKAKCEEYVQQAENDAKEFWQDICERIRDPYMEHERWMQIHTLVTGKLHEKLEF